MTAHVPRRSALLLALGALSLPQLAWAAPCGRPDVDLTFPPNGAVDVPSNGGFVAHYSSPAVYDAEPVTFDGPDGEAVAATIAFDAAESLLRVTPLDPLREGQHRLTWPGLRGVGGGTGRGSTTSFTVGGPDSAGPSFEGLVGIDWDLARERDACTDKLDDRFVFRLQVGSATDDAPAELLALLVFETRDPHETRAEDPAPVALRPYPGARGVVEVRRPADAAGKTCFAAVVQDLRGTPSGGGERQVCVKTKQPPFFDGCSLVRPPPPARPAGALLAGLALGLFRRGRDARRRLA